MVFLMLLKDKIKQLHISLTGVKLLLYYDYDRLFFCVSEGTVEFHPIGLRHSRFAVFRPSPLWKNIKKTPPQGWRFFGALEGTRTPDLLVRSQSLYPAELRAHIRLLLIDSFIIIPQLF